jgi:pyruvate dehydrogenase complex dehydrogenase (E1) component
VVTDSSDIGSHHPRRAGAADAAAGSAGALASDSDLDAEVISNTSARRLVRETASAARSERLSNSAYD